MSAEDIENEMGYRRAVCDLRSFTRCFLLGVEPNDPATSQESATNKVVSAAVLDLVKAHSEAIYKLTREHSSAEDVRRNIEEVVKETFRGQPNWGRFAALFFFYYILFKRFGDLGQNDADRIVTSMLPQAGKWFLDNGKWVSK